MGGRYQPDFARTLRHSYATRLIERGVDIRIVQILLGHHSIATTAIYEGLVKYKLDSTDVEPALAELWCCRECPTVRDKWSNALSR